MVIVLPLVHLRHYLVKIQQQLVFQPVSPGSPIIECVLLYAQTIYGATIKFVKIRVQQVLLLIFQIYVWVYVMLEHLTKIVYVLLTVHLYMLIQIPDYALLNAHWTDMQILRLKLVFKFVQRDPIEIHHMFVKLTVHH